MIVGIDEVGFGPLAGPVCAAAVMIDDGAIEGVRDSKLVAEETRYELADLIRRRAFWTAIAVEGPSVINEKGLGWCWTKLIVELAHAAHAKFPEADILIDNAPTEHMAGEVLCKAPYVKFVKNGDDTVYQIAAASIVAKAYRDKLMIEAAKQYPAYGWDRNKAYGTPEHVKAIREKGMCPLHRIKAVKRALRPKGGKVKDPADEVADYSPAKAKEYIERAGAAGLVGDFETKYITDMGERLGIQGDLSPRQKFFLRSVTHRAEYRARKVRK